jgi:uracil DNA glycosylase
MLNTCLTVRPHTAGSHKDKGWEQFTDRVIEVVDRYGGANLGDKSGFGRGVVFLAWGSWAAKRVAKLSKVSVRRQTYWRASSLLDPSLPLPPFFSSFPLSFVLYCMLTASSSPLVPFS